MRWHKFRCLDFDAMDWTFGCSVCGVRVAVFAPVFVFDVVLHTELGCVMLQRQQGRLGCARCFQSLAGDCIDLVTASNERHGSSTHKRCNTEDSEYMRASLCSRTTQPRLSRLDDFFLPGGVNFE